MNNQSSINRRSQLLRVSLTLGAVLFCIAAGLQMQTAWPLSAQLSEPKERLTSGAEANIPLLPVPIEHTITTDFEGVNDVYAVDLDGDGDIDIIGGSLSQKGFTWWENKDRKWLEHSVLGSYSDTISIHAVDIDNDKDIDVVGAARADNAIVLWKNDGTSTNEGWNEIKVLPSSSGSINKIWDIYAAQIDNGEGIDILGAFYGGNIIWWQNSNGNGETWTSHIVATPPANRKIDQARGIYADDIDGDGYNDVLGASATGSEHIIWWKNQNQESPWDSQSVSNDFQGAEVVYAAKIRKDNNNSYLDIIGGGEKGIAWWDYTNNNDSNWTKFWVDKTFTNTKSIIAADLDLDGDMDILGAGENGIAWWENDGMGHNGTPWPKRTIESELFDKATAVVVHTKDINGDGYPDILAAGESTISWWQLVPYNVYLPIQRKDPTPIPTATDTPTTTFTPTQTPTETLIPSPTPTCIRTEQEETYENDSFADVVDNPPACQEVRGKVSRDDEEDWYKIQVDEEGKRLKVELTNIPKGSDYNLQIKDGNNQQIAFSGNKDDDNELIICPVEANTYYIRIYSRKDDEPSQVSYSLTWKLIEKNVLPSNRGCIGRGSTGTLTPIFTPTITPIMRTPIP